MLVAAPTISAVFSRLSSSPKWSLLSVIDPAWLLAADGVSFLVSVLAITGIVVLATESKADPEPLPVDSTTQDTAEVQVGDDTRIRTTIKRLRDLDNVALACVAILTGGRFVAGLIFVEAIDAAGHGNRFDSQHTRQSPTHGNVRRVGHSAPLGAARCYDQKTRKTTDSDRILTGI